MVSFLAIRCRPVQGVHQQYSPFREYPGVFPAMSCRHLGNNAASAVEENRPSFGNFMMALRHFRIGNPEGTRKSLLPFPFRRVHFDHDEVWRPFHIFQGFFRGNAAQEMGSCLIGRICFCPLFRILLFKRGCRCGFLGRNASTGGKRQCEETKRSTEDVFFHDGFHASL